MVYKVLIDDNTRKLIMATENEKIISNGDFEMEMIGEFEDIELSVKAEDEKTVFTKMVEFCKQYWGTDNKGVLG